MRRLWRLDYGQRRRTTMQSLQNLVGEKIMGLDMYLLVNKKIPFDKGKYTEKFIANQSLNDGNLEFTTLLTKGFIGIYWRKFYDLHDWIFDKILDNNELSVVLDDLIALQKIYDNLIKDECKKDECFHLELKQRLNDLITKASNDSEIKFQYWPVF